MMEFKRGHTGILGRWQLGIRRNNQQLFTNEAALGPVRQIIDNRLIWLCLIFHNLVDFQRPDRVRCSFGSALKFAWLIQIPHIMRGGSFFSAAPTGLLYFFGNEETAFSLIATAGFLPIRLVTSLFRALTTSGSLFTHSVDRLPSGRSISTAY